MPIDNQGRKARQSSGNTQKPVSEPRSGNPSVMVCELRAWFTARWARPPATMNDAPIAAKRVRLVEYTQTCAASHHHKDTLHAQVRHSSLDTQEAEAGHLATSSLWRRASQ